MGKRIIFCVALFSLVISAKQLNAQTQSGQIVVNAGVGESPGFNGDDGTGPATFPLQLIPYYPVTTCLPSLPQSADDLPTFNCTNITPNIGGTLDVGIFKFLSIGFAASYHSETATWYQGYDPYSPAGINKI